MVNRYWHEAIFEDCQKHATELIKSLGFEGMKQYWNHSLEEEAAGYVMKVTDSIYRIDMHTCPSKGFLISNGLCQYHDYCDHCMGWVNPLMKEAGFVIDHEHDHQGHCWWEFRKAGDPAPLTPPGGLGDDDVRLKPSWNEKTVQVFKRETGKSEEA